MVVGGCSWAIMTISAHRDTPAVQCAEHGGAVLHEMLAQDDIWLPHGVRPDLAEGLTMNGWG